MTYVEVLRHFLATIGYRTHVVFDGAPTSYALISISEGIRTPLEIVNHMSDVLALAYSILTSMRRAPLVDISVFQDAKNHFYKNLEHLDKLLASSVSISEDACYRLIQGPISDVLTHIGQLTMIRRASGVPIGEHIRYSTADVHSGVFGGNNTSGTNDRICSTSFKD